MEQEDWARKVQQVITRAWTDEGFKQMLIEEPAAVLRQAGLEFPEGLEIRVVENSDRVFHLVLPSPPPDCGLTDEELRQVAGGEGRGGWDRDAYCGSVRFFV